MGPGVRRTRLNFFWNLKGWLTWYNFVACDTLLTSCKNHMQRTSLNTTCSYNCHTVLKLVKKKITTFFVLHLTIIHVCRLSVWFPQSNLCCRLVVSLSHVAKLYSLNQPLDLTCSSKRWKPAHLARPTTCTLKKLCHRKGIFKNLARVFKVCHF